MNYQPLTSEARLMDSPVAQLGEGAIWDAHWSRLLWIDIEGKRFFIYDPELNKHTEYKTEKRPGTIVPETKSTVVVALEDGLYRWDLDHDRGEFLGCPASLGADERFNDGKCDPGGRLWVGSMKTTGRAGGSFLYRYDGNGRFSEMVDSVSISNGICWSEDKKTMYYIDTPTRRVAAFDFDLPTGNISNRRIAVQVPDSLGHPDGMTIDSDDHIWVALWGGSGVACFDPLSGKLLKYIKVTARNVTSCAFGGPDMRTLYITTAREGTGSVNSGRMFTARPGAMGVKANYFMDKDSQK